MKFEVQFQGFRDDKKWPHFVWSVRINGESFEYRTGTGHETPCFQTRNGYRMKRNTKPKDREVIFNAERESWVHCPKEKDVLQCLFSDAELGAESFDEFCLNMGVSNDSIKAFDSYRACMESRQKLLRALGAEYSAIREKTFQEDAENE